LSVLEELTNEKAGILFKAIYSFQKGIETELDFGLKMAFLPFKNQFIRDEEKYEEAIDLSSTKGKLGNLKRWHIDLYMQVLDKQLTIDEAIEIVKHRHSDKPDTPQSPPIPKSLVSVSVNDSVNDKDIDSDKSISLLSIEIPVALKDEEKKKEKKKLRQKEKKEPSDKYLKFLKWANEYVPTVMKMKKPLTDEELDKLLLVYDKERIKLKLMAMENKPNLLKEYASTYLTVSNWLEKDFDSKKPVVVKPSGTTISNINLNSQEY
jgi:hypothetical protein